jgi:hypothetical protein
VDFRRAPCLTDEYGRAKISSFDAIFALAKRPGSKQTDGHPKCSGSGERDLQLLRDAVSFPSFFVFACFYFAANFSIESGIANRAKRNYSV